MQLTDTRIKFQSHQMQIIWEMKAITQDLGYQLKT